MEHNGENVDVLYSRWHFMATVMSMFIFNLLSMTKKKKHFLPELVKNMYV